MRIAVIGRSELIFDAAERIAAEGRHEIVLVVTAKEAPEYRVTAEDFERLASRTGATFIRTAAISGIVERIRALPPIDIAISANYPGIVPQPVIDCFRLGILNVHAGDLPAYRGNAPLAWAILNKEERVGLCVHQMVGGELDSGDIVARDFHPVGERTKVGELWRWMLERTPDLVAEALTRLELDSEYVLERQSTDPRDALRCYPRRPEDGRIDWSADAASVLRLINASGEPFAGAFFQFAGETYSVVDAEPVERRENFLAVPGQVTAISPDFIEVATGGSGKVRLTRLRKDGADLAPGSVVRSIRDRLG